MSATTTTEPTPLDLEADREELEERLAATEEKLADARDDVRILGDQIGEAVADGEDPTDLREERDRRRQEAEDLESAAAVLQERIREARRRELRGKARAVLREAEEEFVSQKERREQLREELPGLLDDVAEKIDAFFRAEAEQKKAGRMIRELSELADLSPEIDLAAHRIEGRKVDPLRRRILQLDFNDPTSGPLKPVYQTKGPSHWPEFREHRELVEGLEELKEDG